MDNNASTGNAAEVDERSDGLLPRIPDAAGLLGIGRTTLYKLIDDGELAVVRIGRAVRVRIVEVHAFVAPPASHRGRTLTPTSPSSRAAVGAVASDGLAASHPSRA